MARVIGPLGLLAAFAAAGGVAARAAAAETPPRTAPTREYVYAGSRLLAVVGPLPSVRPAGAPPSLAESDGTARLEVELRTPDGAPLATEASFAFRTAAGTARAGEDFAVAEGRRSFPPGTLDGTRAEIAVALVDDARHEVAERFAIELHDAVGLGLEGVRLEVEVRDDDPPPVVNVLPTRVPEGHSGTIPAVLTLALSAESGVDATVAYATADGTAIAGSGYVGDYVAATGTVTVPAGQTAATLSVAVRGDTALEPDETFDVVFSAPEHATLAVERATVTIAADDWPRVSVAPALASEGVPAAPWIEPGVAKLTVTLEAWTGRATVEYRTEDDTATAGQDYVATTGTLVFDHPEQLQQTVRVPILDDLLAEGPERFRLVLHSPTGAILGTATAHGVLRDDETSPAPPPGNPPPGEEQ